MLKIGGERAVPRPDALGRRRRRAAQSGATLAGNADGAMGRPIAAYMRSPRRRCEPLAESNPRHGDLGVSRRASILRFRRVRRQVVGCWYHPRSAAIREISLSCCGRTPARAYRDAWVQSGRRVAHELAQHVRDPTGRRATRPRAAMWPRALGRWAMSRASSRLFACSGDLWGGALVGHCVAQTACG